MRVAAMLSSQNNPLSFVAAGSAGTGANPTAALPSGWATGDLLVVCGTSNGTWSGLSGWNTLVNNNTGSRLLVSWKVATSGETALSLTNNGGDSLCVMVAYRNGAPALDVAGTLNTSGDSTPDTLSLTTTVADTLVISVYGSTSNNITWSSAPSGTTARATVYNGTTSLLLLADEVQTAVGATTARSATASNTFSCETFAAAFKN